MHARRWVGDLDVQERLQADYAELFRVHQVGFSCGTVFIRVPARLARCL